MVGIARGHDWVGAYGSLAPATWRCRGKVESGIEEVGTKTMPSCQICFQRMYTIHSMGWLRLRYEYVAVSTNTLLLNKEAQTQLLLSVYYTVLYCTNMMLRVQVPCQGFSRTIYTALESSI